MFHVVVDPVWLARFVCLTSANKLSFPVNVLFFYLCSIHSLCKHMRPYSKSSIPFISCYSVFLFNCSNSLTLCAFCTVAIKAPHFFLYFLFSFSAPHYSYPPFASALFCLSAICFFSLFASFVPHSLHIPHPFISRKDTSSLLHILS